MNEGEGQLIPTQTSAIDARQNVGNVYRSSAANIGRTGSTAGEVAGPAIRVASLSWDQFTAANWATFNALNWTRFTAYQTGYIAGLLRIVSDLYVAGSSAGETLLDDAIGQLLTRSTEGQITHD